MKRIVRPAKPIKPQIQSTPRGFTAVAALTASATTATGTTQSRWYRRDGGRTQRAAPKRHASPAMAKTHSDHTGSDSRSITLADVSTARRVPQAATAAGWTGSRDRRNESRNARPGSGLAFLLRQSGWARQVSNLRPSACKADALPLSYAPGSTASLAGRCRCWKTGNTEVDPGATRTTRRGTPGSIGKGLVREPPGPFAMHSGLVPHPGDSARRSGSGPRGRSGTYRGRRSPSPH
jgi:hypothetical protein